MKRILRMNSSAFAALVIVLTGCDVFQKDPDVVVPSPVQNMDMFVLQNKAAVIDLNQAFPNFGKVDLPGGQPNVKYFGARYIKYQSAGSNADKFNFFVVTADNQKLNASVNVHTDASNSCGEPFTYARIKKDSKLAVNLFNNPEFCDYDIHSHSGIAVAEKPTDFHKNTDGVLLAICACGSEGNTAIFNYNPPKGFVGQVVGKYYLGILLDTSTPLLQEDYYNPAKFKYYSAQEYTIDVVDEP